MTEKGETKMKVNKNSRTSAEFIRCPSKLFFDQMFCLYTETFDQAFIYFV